MSVSSQVVIIENTPNPALIERPTCYLNYDPVWHPWPVCTEVGLCSGRGGRCILIDFHCVCSAVPLSLSDDDGVLTLPGNVN